MVPFVYRSVYARAGREGQGVSMIRSNCGCRGFPEGCCEPILRRHPPFPACLEQRNDLRETGAAAAATAIRVRRRWSSRGGWVVCRRIDANSVVAWHAALRLSADSDVGSCMQAGESQREHECWLAGGRRCVRACCCCPTPLIACSPPRCLASLVQRGSPRASVHSTARLKLAAPRHRPLCIGCVGRLGVVGSRELARVCGSASALGGGSKAARGGYGAAWGV